MQPDRPEEAEMSTAFRQQLLEEFDVPASLAVWLVLTHIWVLASPLALIWAVDAYSDQLTRPFANPTLIMLASAVYIGATAFEVAQNTVDRWYLTKASMSGADLAFNAFMTVAFCMYTIGFYGNTWMVIAAVLLTLAYPVAYINNHPSHRAISGIVVTLGTASAWLATGDPVVWLFMVGNVVAVYLFVFLFKYGSQWLHAWAAFTFGLAFLSWPWAIVNAAKGEPKSWLFVAGVTAAVVAVMAALVPLLAKTRLTPRRYG